MGALQCTSFFGDRTKKTVKSRLKQSTPDKKPVLDSESCVNHGEIPKTNATRDGPMAMNEPPVATRP